MRFTRSRRVLAENSLATLPSDIFSANTALTEMLVSTGSGPEARLTQHVRSQRLGGERPYVSPVWYIFFQYRAGYPVRAGGGSFRENCMYEVHFRSTHARRTLANNPLPSLPASIFSTNTALTRMRVHGGACRYCGGHLTCARRHLSGNLLTALPSGIFSSNTALKYLCASAGVAVCLCLTVL